MSEREDMVFTFDEFRKYLKLGRNTALRLLQTGEVKGKKVGRQWRILKSEVVKYLRDHK